MPAYNFQGQFADAVEDGTKRQTVRKRRKRATQVGDRLFLYTGLRTPKSRLLLITPCSSVRAIRIWPETMVIAGEVQSPDQCEAFARADGFSDYGAFVAFIQKTHGLPFEGEVIGW